MKIKKAIALLLTFVVAFAGISYSGVKNESVEAAQEWELVWSDEFNQSSLDTNTWTYEIGNGNWGWGNGEVQYYTDRKDNVDIVSNSEADDGKALAIIAKKENYGGCKYTSGRIISKKKKAFKYGYVEARLKVENGNQTGVWPAFWMMGNNIDSVGWPRCGETDIMEHANSNNHIGGCLHWGVDGSTNHGSYGSGDAGSDYYFTDNVNNGINGWHTYGLLWDENHMEWYVDGKKYFEQSITDSNAYCFQKEQFLLFNLAIGGTGTGFTGYQTADPNTYKTTTMFVDYVRVYQEKEEPTTKYDGPTITITEDAVAKSTATWGSFFGNADWCGGANGTLTNNGKASDGVTIDVTTMGTDRWGIQASLKGLSYYSGNTYTYKCTLTSDEDKVVFVKVAGDSDEEISGEYVSLKAGVPYNYSKEVAIAEDYEGVLDLFFGLGRCDGDTLNSTDGYTLKIENVSFTTTAEIPDPDYVVPTTTVAPVNPETTTVSVNPETTTVLVAPETTTVVSIDPGTTDETMKNETTNITAPKKAKIKKAVKKSAKVVKVSLKKIKGVKGYKVKISSTKKFKKSKTVTKYVKKAKFKIKSKKFKNKKKLYVKARAYKVVNGEKIYGKWSKRKKVKIKK